MSRRLVVTLPPGVEGEAAREYAGRARALGASLLELRTDLHPRASLDPVPLAERIDLLVAQRGPPLPPSWRQASRVVDREVTGPRGDQEPGGEQLMLSHHAPRPLRPEEALAFWRGVEVPPGTMVKHVEPLGNPASACRLMETQRRLRQALGMDRVTVLATGHSALPIRCMLSRANALEFVAMDPSWRAAPGQRLLEDAVRDARCSAPDRPRLGIVGARIAGSRSPRLHRQPFDRIDLPEDVALGELLDALRPFYAGLAVTSPFKGATARHLRSPLAAVNTLVRRPDGWEAYNTDVDGARAVLEALKASEVTLLGLGGAAVALGEAAACLGVELRTLRRGEVGEHPVRGTVIWTWPAHLPTPTDLRFEGARVAIIAYGAPARIIAREVSGRGGIPLRLGPRWLIAQARRQRELWGGPGI